MDRIKTGFKNVMRHFQTGVSYLIPLLTASGMLTSLAVIFGGSDVWNHTDNFWGVLRMIGHTGLQFIVPMISGFVAFSVADRPGLAPGFITGLIANEMGTGFIGGMITGLLSGYLAEWLKKNLKVPERIQTLKVLFLIPIITTFTVGVVLWYVIGRPITSLTNAISNWLNGLSGAKMGVLGVVLGAMMAFDMGGPINKIAYAFGQAAYADGNHAVSTMMYVAIGLPPFIMWLASKLKPALYSEEEHENANVAIIMGLVGITEGTIPFAIADPLTVIPSICVGTAVTSAMLGILKVVNTTTMSTFMAIPFTNNILLYIISILVGGLVGALMVNFLKGRAQRKVAED